MYIKKQWLGLPILNHFNTFMAFKIMMFKISKFNCTLTGNYFNTCISLKIHVIVVKYINCDREDQNVSY